MNDWQKTTLGAVCAAGGGTIQTGPFGSQLHAADYVFSGIPSVMPQNIGENRIVEDGIARITEEDALRLSKYRLATNDIVYSRRGDVERRALVRPENNGWLCGTGCLKVSFGNNPVVDPAFISYFLGTQESREWIVRHAVGATMLNLNTRILQNVPLLVPTLPEQQAIAEVLCALDDKIAANIRLAATSALLAQSVFAATATDTQGIEVALADSCSLLSRGITPKYSTDDETMVVLNQKCVRGQRVDLAPARRTLLAKVRQDKELLLDDVLVNSTGQGTLGRVARWTHDERVTVDSHITIVRFKPEVVDPVCGGFAVLRNEENITAMAEGSTGQTELSRVELGKLTLRLPPREKQQALGHQLAKMTSMENAYLLESQTLAKTRDALLPRLMSGQISVKEAEALVTGAI